MEEENAALRRRIQQLERELQGQSPIRGKPLQELDLPIFSDSEDKENESYPVTGMSSLQLDSDDVFAPSSEAKQSMILKTPGKKMRKLTPRNNVGLGDEDLAVFETP